VLFIIVYVVYARAFRLWSCTLFMVLYVVYARARCLGSRMLFMVLYVVYGRACRLLSCTLFMSMHVFMLMHNDYARVTCLLFSGTLPVHTHESCLC